MKTLEMIIKYKNHLALSFFTFILLVGSTPFFANAAGIVPDCIHTVSVTHADGSSSQVSVVACQFSDLVILLNNIINFLLFSVMIPAATLSIAVIGFQYLAAAGNPGKLAKVHELFKDVLWGIFLALAAYSIIELIFSVLTKAGTIPSITG